MLQKSLEDNTIDQNEYKRFTEMYTNYQNEKKGTKKYFFSVNFFSNNKFKIGFFL